MQYMRRPRNGALRLVWDQPADAEVLSMRGHSARIIWADDSNGTTIPQFSCGYWQWRILSKQEQWEYLMNTLIIGDLHLPFVHRDYLDFVLGVKKAYKCTRVVCVGDVVDNHAMSFHEHNPDGMSAGDELKAVRLEVKKWSKAFPRMDCAIGNHDEIVRRQTFGVGLSSAYLKSFRDAYQAPKSWIFDFKFTYRNWLLTHGTGTNGHDAAFKAAVKARISTVQGHIHSASGVKFHASDKDIIWGMQTGCGVNRKSYAFSYGRDFQDKPILSCAVVLEDGTLPIVIPMKMS